MPDYGMPKSKNDGSKGKLFIQVMITSPEPKAWSPEDAAKLQSVLGGSSPTFDNENAKVLSIESADSKLVVG
jgi:hypothetical protein